MIPIWDRVWGSEVFGDKRSRRFTFSRARRCVFQPLVRTQGVTSGWGGAGSCLVLPSANGRRPAGVLVDERATRGSRRRVFLH